MYKCSHCPALIPRRGYCRSCLREYKLYHNKRLHIKTSPFTKKTLEALASPETRLKLKQVWKSIVEQEYSLC